MKKYLLIFAVLFASLSQVVFSWDADAGLYFPLKIGNKWVYRGTFSAPTAFARSYQKYTVTGVKDSLGKKYYEIDIKIYMITGQISPDVMQFDHLIRIDSATMNIYKLQQYCSSNEWLLDSLSAKKNDSLKICPFQFYSTSSVCADTSNYNIFSSSYPSKTYSEFFWTRIQHSICKRDWNCL